MAYLRNNLRGGLALEAHAPFIYNYEPIPYYQYLPYYLAYVYVNYSLPFRKHALYIGPLLGKFFGGQISGTSPTSEHLDLTRKGNIFGFQLGDSYNMWKGFGINFDLSYKAGLVESSATYRLVGYPTAIRSNEQSARFVTIAGGLHYQIGKK